MCDTYEPPRLLKDGTMTPIKPIPTNTRAACADVMERAKDQEPWFGIEQVRAAAYACSHHPAVEQVGDAGGQQSQKSCLSW
jgi:hypothetical protein